MTEVLCSTTMQCLLLCKIHRSQNPQPCFSFDFSCTMYTLQHILTFEVHIKIPPVVVSYTTCYLGVHFHRKCNKYKMPLTKKSPASFNVCLLVLYLI